MKEKVVVLMSTYNGERYLREQIDSVLNQKNVDVILEIRDDGSKDSTINIIKEYSQKDSRVIFHQGENVGPLRSFFSLLEKAIACDFYAFCDQDDYWEPDKLETAIKELSMYDMQKPTLYCSSLNIVDENLNFCRVSKVGKKVRSKYSALVDFYAVGCTEVFNAAAANCVKNHLNNDCLMHDSWLFLICSFFGNVVYDSQPHIKYRQHSNNVIGSNISRIGRIKDSWNRLFDRNVQPRFINAKALLESCEQELSKNDVVKIRKITNYKQSIFKTLSLLFDISIKSNSIFSDIKYRLMIIMRII